MEKIEKIEKFFMSWTILIILSYLLVFIGNQGSGLLCAICGFCGRLLQSPTSSIDLLLTHFNIDWIICILGLLFFINRIIINNKLKTILLEN